MKHLLFRQLFFVIILLVSTNSHGVFWCEFESAVGEYYSGGCETYSGGSRAEGYGTLRGKYFEYDGEWSQGLWHGNGVLTFTNGEQYAGEFKNGKFHYMGEYTWPDGSEYVGQFEDNKRNGHGTIVYANGDRYVGEFEDGERHGQGTYTWIWTSKNMRVEGLLKLIHGTRNVGEWRNGKEWNITKYDKFGAVIGTWTNGIYRIYN